jgi:hypothetical protein
MAAQYLADLIQELRRDGEATFRKKHTEPVLVVIEAAGGSSGNDSGETTVMADTGGWTLQEASLSDRVFPVSRGPFATSRPILLGRTDAADIHIPDDSVSKKHCLFEAQAGGMTITDLGSTNGTAVNDVDLAPNQPQPLTGGDTIRTGHFVYLFHTPDTFVAYLKVLKI